MLRGIINRLLDRFSASGASGPLADRARARIRAVRGPQEAPQPEASPPAPRNRRERRAAASEAKRKKRP